MATLRKDPAPVTSTAGRVPNIIGISEEDGPAALNPNVARPFVLVWSRGDYIVSGSGTVVPRLVQQPLMSGVGGVVERRPGSWDLSGLADDARQAGKRVLPMELGYCVGVDGTIDCWRPLWSEVRGGVIVEDTAAYEVWLQGLMDSGTLPRPTPEQCRAQAERLDNLCAMDPAKAGHSREVKAYERLRDAALRAAEVAA